ncbi:NYN domain-containing protein [bacterium]|nr:NYN domain-containing protein [bacterium]
MDASASFSKNERDLGCSDVSAGTPATSLPVAPRAIAYMDAAYVERMLKADFPGISIDYRKLVLFLSRDQELARLRYYTCRSFLDWPPTKGQIITRQNLERFFRFLSHVPSVELRFGRLEKRRNRRDPRLIRYEQKRTDVELACDLLEDAIAGKMTTAILFAGDSDFVPAVEKAKGHGVGIHLYHGRGESRPHRDLYKLADRRTPIDRFLLERIGRDPNKDPRERRDPPADAQGRALRESA